MNDRELVYLLDMLNAAREALSFMGGRSCADLEQNRMLLLAVIKEIEIVGEAATHISAETRSGLSKIPWKDVVGMRNQLIHVYSRIDRDIVWSTLINDLPPVIAELERIFT